MNATARADFEKKRKLVDRRLVKILREASGASVPKELARSIGYAVMAGGKRLRPIIAIMVCELFGGDANEIARPACALELIHAASLILDDLPAMDDAKLRRGKKAHHLVFGESTTILTGFALVALAFELCAEEEPAVARLITKEVAESGGAKGLVGGQFLDLSAFSRKSVVRQLDACYRLKAGALFRGAAAMGAIFGGAKPRELRILKDFGMELGVLFQVRDDIIDAEASMAKTGKDVRVDLKNRKPSYASIFGSKRAKQMLSRKIESVCADVRASGLPVHALIEFARSLAL